MLLWLWWTLKRAAWSLLPLPRSIPKRDRALADRAAATLDKHLSKIPSSVAYSLDPHRPSKNGPKIQAATPATQRLLEIAMDRTERACHGHSMQGHLLSGLMRSRDPEAVAHSKRIEAFVRREAEEEKARRASILPPAPTEIDIEEIPPTPRDAGSRGTL